MFMWSFGPLKKRRPSWITSSGSASGEQSASAQACKVPAIDGTSSKPSAPRARARLAGSSAHGGGLRASEIISTHSTQPLNEQDEEATMQLRRQNLQLDSMCQRPVDRAQASYLAHMREHFMKFVVVEKPRFHAALGLRLACAPCGNAR